jgi:enamine deaminase RidA (YjgF/YER057c/UK114 family)
MTAVNELTYVKWARKGKLRRTHYRRVFSRESELRYTWAIMKTKLFSWLGTEFVEITGEAKAGAPPDSSVNELFRQFEAELKSHGLSLDNTARIRVWGRDKDARTLATAARSKILTGNRKAASSSFISRQWFDSDATAGLELLAMRPINLGAERRPVDFEPARNYLCYLRYESVLFYSGFTSDAPTLEEQVPDVLRTLANAFAVSGASWSKVVKLSILLDRTRNLEVLRNLLAQGPKMDVAEVEFSFVDGFAGEKYLLEIEATAVSE